MNKSLYLFVLLILLTLNGISQNITSDTSLANQYYYLAKNNINDFNLDSAILFADQAQDMYISYFGINSLKNADINNLKGEIFYYLSNYNKSIKFYLEALTIRLDILGEKHPDVATCYSNIGSVYADKGDYISSLEFYQKAINIFIETLGPEHIEVANMYYNVGLVQSEKAEYRLALNYYQKALKIFNKIVGEKHPNIASLYNCIGLVYSNIDEYDLALEYFYKALSIQLDFFNEKNPNVAMSYNLIGVVYWGKGEYEKALEFYQKALIIFMENLGEKHPRVSVLLSNIGVVFWEKGEYDKALEYYQKDLQLSLEVLGEKHPNIAITYGCIGSVYKSKGNFKKAIEFHQKALEIKLETWGKKHPDLAVTYNKLGALFEKENDLNKALLMYQKALYSNLTNLKDTSNFSTVPIIDNYLRYNDLLESLQAKAHIYSKYTSDTKLVLSYYQACDTLIDQTRKKISQTNDKIELGKTAYQIYSGAVDACLKLAYSNNPTTVNLYKELAFNFSEKNKSMVLLEALAGQEGLKFAGIPDSLLEKEHSLKVDIALFENKLAEMPDSSTEANYRSKLFTANRQYEELIARFEKQYPDYYNLKYTSKIPTVTDIQKLLDKQTALRSYFVIDSVIYIFTITKKDLNVVQVPKMENFDDSLKYFRYGLTFTSQRMKEYYRRLGYSLNQQLFPDVLDKNIQNIIIVPDGNLGIIPFESLLTTDYTDDIDNYKDYPYLIKKYNISYSYSANLYAKTFPKDKTKNVEFTNLNDWLAFAPVFSDENKSGTALVSRELRNAINKSSDDSLMTRGTLISGEYINPLPGTEQETQNIFNLFNQKNKKAQLLLYDKASENYLKSGNLNQYRIIHFATHGFVNTEKPELSGIILNQDTIGGEDGILYSGELYNLKMNADLVVLSACETGLGKIRKGEGIIGLTRALLYAGAKNIVVSLWQVSDKSTSDLMIDFYKNITENEKQNHSKSLQLAKLKMIRESSYAHPFYWSPFILIGK